MAETRVRPYPHIRTLRGSEVAENLRCHPVLEVVFAEGEEPRRFCGYSWCTGEECKLPAAVLPGTADYPFEKKMYSDMTACGPVMQTWRVAWTGEKFVIPEIFRKNLEGAMWW